MSQTSQVIYCKSQQAKKTTAKGFTFHSYLKSCKNHRADINFAIVRTADRWTDKSQRQVERVGEEGDQKDWGTSRRNRGTWITQASNGLSELILTITLSLSHTHTHLPVYALQQQMLADREASSTSSSLNHALWFHFSVSSIFVVPLDCKIKCQSSFALVVNNKWGCNSVRGDQWAAGLGEGEREGLKERERQRLFDSVSCIEEIQTGHSSQWIR